MSLVWLCVLLFIIYVEFTELHGCSCLPLVMEVASC